MWQGTIIEQSLTNSDVLESLNVTKTWADEDWVLHDFEAGEEAVPAIQQSLADGPWYVHLWRGKEIIIIFKERIFRVHRFDKATWQEAIEYGKSKGIPIEQLDFITK
jgi:hypothetical protein